jgi:hypothetical protein
MSATVLVRDATLKTLAVSVQTLRLGPKQVTLAVFRQLLQEEVIDDDGLFRGLVWGTVNYHPDGCASGPAHLHVVWQKGDELRRAYVERPERPRGGYGSDAADDWLVRALDAGWRPSSPAVLPWKQQRGRRNDGSLRESFDELVADIWICPEAKAVLKSWEWERETKRESMDEFESKWMLDLWGRLHERAVELPPLDTLTAETEAELAAEHKRWDEYEQRWRELEAAPQLFIAA